MDPLDESALDESPLDAPLEDPTITGTDFEARLDAVDKRLDELAAREPTYRLTEPDEGSDERWEAGQVWAHVAEVVPYWHEQIQSVIGEYDGTPVPFGRTKTDRGRIEGIEIGRRESIAVLRDRVRDSVSAIRAYLGGLTPAQWSAVGVHPRRGEMDVEQIVEEFVVGHLEEHADQLDGLA